MFLLQSLSRGISSMAFTTFSLNQNTYFEVFYFLPIFLFFCISHALLSSFSKEDVASILRFLLERVLLEHVDPEPCRCKVRWTHFNIGGSLHTVNLRGATSLRSATHLRLVGRVSRRTSWNRMKAYLLYATLALNEAIPK